MNTLPEIKRREFLKATSGAVGLATLLEGISALNSFGAEGAGKPGPINKEALNQLLAEMDTVGRKMLSVPRQDGQFLNLMVKATRAKSVLEIGTSQGYSAIWISLGLEETGGKMTTIDIAPDKVELAKANVAKAGLTRRVTFHEGDAHQIVPTLEGPFDFVFLDADKEGQLDYFNKLYPKKLAPGAIIAVHNAIRARNSMKDYMDMISKHAEFDTVTLSLTMQDGFEVSYRKRV
ncbi:MAG: O-methyltransferase [Verrucomicrobiota bacterium]